MNNYRCIVCGSPAPVEDRMTTGDPCPICNTVRNPLDVNEDVTITLNWRELQMIAMWSLCWTIGQSETENVAILYAMIARAQSQHPEMPPILPPWEYVFSESDDDEEAHLQFPSNIIPFPPTITDKG